jgi:hypothetical protein
MGMLRNYLSLSLISIQLAEIRRYYASIFTAVAGWGRSEARDRNGLQILHPNQRNWAETRGSRVQLLTPDSAGRTYPFGPILHIRNIGM